MPATFSIYLRPEDQAFYEKFKQILKREGSNVSRHIKEYMIHYVETHDPGNPQARMTSFVEGGSYDIASLEGEIRQIFLQRSRKSIEVKLADIKQICRAHLDVDPALAMAERTHNWLKSQGVKVWG